MTDTEFFRTTSLTRVNAALALLDDVQIEPGVISKGDVAVVLNHLRHWQRNLSERLAVRPKEPERE